MANGRDAVKGRSGARRLGRGLTSLISAPVELRARREPAPDEPQTTTAEPAILDDADDHPTDPTVGLLQLATAAIRPNPRQPRQQFDESALESLASSIKSAGLMQPVVVRARADGGGYELIAGERRWRAAQRAGLELIPAVVHDADDRQATVWSLVENVQREDLNPMERASAFRRLLDEFEMTQQEVAEHVGLDRSNVANHLRLLDLEDSLQDVVRAGMLSFGHARALLAVTSTTVRSQLAARAVREGWSVRTIEQEIRRQTSSTGGPSSTRKSGKTVPGASANDANLADLERRLGAHLGTKVTIQTGAKKGAGRLLVEFYSLDQFDGLLERLGLDRAS